MASLGADIEGDKAEAEWTYHWDGTPLKEKPKFKFKVTGNRCKKVESSEVEIGAKLTLWLKNAFGDPLSNVKCKLITSDGSEKSVTTDDQGKIEEEDLIPSEVKVLPEKDEK